MKCSTFPAPQASRSRYWALIGIWLALFISSPASARFGDGKLDLSWTGAQTLQSGSSRLLTDAEFPIDGNFEFVLIGNEEQRVVSLTAHATSQFERLDPGTWRLELRASAGQIVHSWSLFVRSELTTEVTVDLDEGSLSVAPYSPQPFGNWEVWNAAELSILPGQGESALIGTDTNSGSQPSQWLDGIESSGHGVTRPRPFGLDGGLAGAQTPLGAVSAAFAGSGRWLATRPVPDSALRLGGSAGVSSRYLGQGWLTARAPHASLGWLSFSGQFQMTQFGNPGPTGVLSDLDHNELEMLETSLTASVTELGPGRAHLSFYAFGNTRDYYIHEFRENLEHAPREDRAELLGSFAYDVPISKHWISFETQYVRSFFETGDGAAFDRFDLYTDSKSSSRTTPDGLYWAGNDEDTSFDEGKLYDYYRRTLATELRGRVDADLALTSAGPTRVGAEVSLGKWRVFEHLAPSQARGGNDAGFQMTRRFGYTLDGDEQADPAGHEAREPKRTAVFASQDFSLGNMQVQAGARWSRFDSGQRAIRDFENPLGEDGKFGESALAAAATHDQVLPRVGLYLPISNRTHLWLDGGREQIVPPSEAVYYDPDLLVLQAGLAENVPDRFGRNIVFGHADLAPEDKWSGHLGLFHELSPTVSIQFAGYGRRTEDTWVIRAAPVGIDRLLFYDNAGARRAMGMHLGLRWKTGEQSALRVQYDVSRTETNVIEPYPLYEHLRLEDQPVQNIAVRQTALPSNLWIHDGSERDYYPSMLDRTHAVSAVWTTDISAETLGLRSQTGDPGRFAAAFHAASGLPYSPTFVRKEGAVEEALSPARLVDPNDLNNERLPWNWQLDLAYGQPFDVLGYSVFGKIEVQNVTNRRNVQRVYAATGEADDDGWLDTPEGEAAIDSQGTEFEQTYRDRLEDPRNYTDGIHARVSVTVGVF